jgi:hypothetical protein
MSAAVASEDDYFGKAKPRVKPAPKPVQSMPVAPGAVIAPLPSADYHGLTAALTSAKSEYALGEPILVSTTIKCSWEPQRLFNPFLNASLEQPGSIRVFDDGGGLVMEFLGHGSEAANGDSGWVQVYGGCSIGAEIALNPSASGSRKSLAAGTYRIQLVLFDTLLYGFSKDRDMSKAIAASSLVPIRVVGK